MTVWLAAVLAFIPSVLAAPPKKTDAPAFITSGLQPPNLTREFRAGWVATVANIDWPSKPGLPVDQQQSELIAILDRAVELKLNAIIFQVRPACDAMYASKIEPWSYYLTGAMGKPPEPFYDPLAFAIRSAHNRGLELHAWFNPFRALHPSTKSAVSPRHISVTRPELVRHYGDLLWLDPGERDVQEYSLQVVMDVVKRYDVDGVHFDDYFYPYKVKDSQKNNIDFPDELSWKHFGARGGLNREDWRRENVNSFIQRVYRSIKEAKPWVKFGISPFGIWQQGYPSQIKGMSSYQELYCDSRKWLLNGWLDYCTPQLYWEIQPVEHSYPALLKWWSEQNPLHRHVWPGLNSGHVGDKWNSEEIVNQIKLTRNQNSSGGHIHWSMKSLMDNRGGLAAALKTGLYAEPALIPPSPWLDRKLPAQPKMGIGLDGRLTWSAGNSQPASLWVVQSKLGERWTTRILPADAHEQLFAKLPDAVALTAIDRCGLASKAAVLERNPKSR